jgi:hypothetical protein
MILHPELTQQPPNRLVIVGTSISAAANFYAGSPSGAYANAVSNLPSWGALGASGTSSFSPSAQGYKKLYELPYPPDHYLGSATASVQRSRYQFVFFTGTCYLQVWWNLVTTSYGPGGGTISTVAKNYLWTPTGSGGLCVPNPATFNPVTDTTVPITPDIFSTWPSSSVFEMDDTEPPDPTSPSSPVNTALYYTTMQNLAWSFVEGYAPPLDGSGPNGFPGT